MSKRIPLFPLLLAGLVLSSVSAGAEQFVGRASIIDGDTIEIAGQRIRLNGIDAPESWQACRDAAGRPYRCGKEAAFVLDEFLSKSRPTRCVGHSKDRYRRVVADCFRADGQSVNSWLVRQGWAIDWLRYSRGAFQNDQAAARNARSGVWRGAFENPCEARAARLKRQAAC
ncbi:thermonuclease family protein [Rhizobium leguminosarum]|uniref:thermonuclease family protein n=1 Tax=Rhizobium leguminosarum TaxID=384 RepID=UPI00102FC380|nr:thermonuclease family protein [Rhizobium leguminosarum]TBF35252.1 thermonuclease family protein [Rhizobium leguminosarum]